MMQESTVAKIGVTHMDKQFLAACGLIIPLLTTYLLIGTLLAGGAVLPLGVLLFVLVLWYSVYRFRYKGTGTRELVTKMYADLKGTLEGMKERIAQEEAQRREAAEHEKQARWDRERRRANRPKRDPTVGKYADIIENKVREGERNRRDSEDPQ